VSGGPRSVRPRIYRLGGELATDWMFFLVRPSDGGLSVEKNTLKTALCGVILHIAQKGFSSHGRVRGSRRRRAVPNGPGRPGSPPSRPERRRRAPLPRPGSAWWVPGPSRGCGRASPAFLGSRSTRGKGAYVCAPGCRWGCPPGVCRWMLAAPTGPARLVGGSVSETEPTPALQGTPWRLQGRTRASPGPCQPRQRAPTFPCEPERTTADRAACTPARRPGSAPGPRCVRAAERRGRWVHGFRQLEIYNIKVELPYIVTKGEQRVTTHMKTVFGVNPWQPEEGAGNRAPSAWSATGAAPLRRTGHRTNSPDRWSPFPPSP
jgi:hypothetical protein